MLVIGFMFGLWRAVVVGRKHYGIAQERIYDLALIILISGVVGARAVYILLNPDTESWREFYAVWMGGLSFHGGLALALVSGYFYTRAVGLSYWKLADLFAPSVALAYAFTRIGCFLNGCCYGAPTDLPWAARFTDFGILTPPSHPTQIYSALASLLIFFILTRLAKLERAGGFVFACYVGLYGIYRFLVEFLRAGYSAEIWRFGITQAQAVSVLMVLGSAIAVWLLYRLPAKRPIE